MLHESGIEDGEAEDHRPAKPRKNDKHRSQVSVFRHSYCAETAETEEQEADLSVGAQLHHLGMDNLRIQHELNVVREAAIQAIIEKEETIEELQSAIKAVQDEADNKRTRTEELQSRVEELQAERRELLRTIERIRYEHIDEITDKDRLICQLGEELDQLRERTDELIRTDRQLTERVEEFESENEQLEYQLEQSKLELNRLKEMLKECELASTTVGNEQQQEDSQELGKEQKDELLTVSQTAIDEESLEKQLARHRLELEGIRRHYEELLVHATEGIYEDDIKQEDQIVSDQQSSSEILQEMALANLKLARRRSSIAACLVQAQEESSRVESATHCLMASLLSLSSFYKDSGFSRHHFCYDQRLHRDEEGTSRRLMMAKPRLNLQSLLETVQERSDSATGRSSRENIYETPESNRGAHSSRSSRTGKLQSVTELSDEENPLEPYQPPEKPASGNTAINTLGRIVGWSAVALASGLLLKYLVRSPPH